MSKNPLHRRKIWLSKENQDYIFTEVRGSARDMWPSAEMSISNSYTILNMKFDTDTPSERRKTIKKLSVIIDELVAMSDVIAAMEE